MDNLKTVIAGIVRATRVGPLSPEDIAEIIVDVLPVQSPPPLASNGVGDFRAVSFPRLQTVRPSVNSQEAEVARLQAALRDATRNLSGAASAYQAFACRHASQGAPTPDALYGTRVKDLFAAAARARAALVVCMEPGPADSVTKDVQQEGYLRALSDVQVLVDSGIYDGKAIHDLLRDLRAGVGS